MLPDAPHESRYNAVEDARAYASRAEDHLFAVRAENLHATVKDRHVEIAKVYADLARAMAELR